jgi:hypothetical protein
MNRVRPRSPSPWILDTNGDCPNILFRYLRRERVDVIERLQIRFTQPSALNGLFELRPRLESLVLEAETLAVFMPPRRTAKFPGSYEKWRLVIELVAEVPA